MIKKSSFLFFVLFFASLALGPNPAFVPTSFAQDDIFDEDFEDDVADSSGDLDESDLDDDLSDLDLDDEDSGSSDVAEDDDFKGFEEEPQEEVVDKDFQELEAEEPVKEEPVVAEEPPQEEEPAVAEELPQEEPEPVVAEEPQESPVEETAFVDLDQDKPNLLYEAELYNIFLNYHSSSTTDEEWMSIIGTRGSESYRIQKGDTLWGLSKIFFGEGGYWPKIWSVNSDINDPHLIEPDNVIRFLLGNEDEAPAFTVTEAEAEYEEETDYAAGDEYLTNEDVEDVIIPPPSEFRQPVVRNMPPSLPKWKTLEESFSESLKVHVERPKTRDASFTIPLAYYVDEKKPDVMAEVIEVETGSVMVSTFQYVYIKAKKGLLRKGDKLLAVKNLGPVLREFSPIEGADIYETQAEVIIEGEVEPIDEYKAYDKAEFFKALVTKSISGLTVGSDLIKGAITQYDVVPNRSKIAYIESKIIGGAYSQSRRFFRKDSLVYLDSGSMRGMEKDMILPVFSDNKIQNARSFIKANHKIIGYLKVLKVTEKYSTAVVIGSAGQLRVGDYTGALKLKQRTSMNEMINGTGATDKPTVVEKVESSPVKKSLDDEINSSIEDEMEENIEVELFE